MSFDGEPRHLSARAVAKINFGLRVLGVREDGYHELSSIFLPLDLADELEFRLGPASRASVRLVLEREGDTPGAELPVDASNLAVRAAGAFFERAGLACALELSLVKRIPVAAGLGGGSSDAGTVLRVLAEAFPGALAPDALAALALSLGADVPFFLAPRPALVSGIGERIEPLTAWPELALVLANPGLPLSTAEVFRACDALGPAALTRPGAASTLPAHPEVAELVAEGRLDALAALLPNDLSSAAVRLCPPVARLQAALRSAGASLVGMSGSGPTVYGVFENAREARLAAEAMAPEAPIWVRVAQSMKAG